MRLKNQVARDQLVAVLARRSAVRAADLAEQLGVSVPTLHRLLREVSGAVISTGQARRTRHALRRPLRGDLADLPLYAVDTNGRAEAVASLTLVRPQGSCMQLAGTGWPVPEESRDGWWDGLPYPLIDMRPRGYMGRQLARAQHRQLAVSDNPEQWSDDDVAYVLSHTGNDMGGNLILGHVAMERWQAQKLALHDAPAAVKPRGLGAAYNRLAELAVASGVPGSSAAGEFPKFPALRERQGSSTPHVLVKFSGADGSLAVQRWADLLVCEHLALECAAGLPQVASARSVVVVHGGRTFLEVERFDRHGLFGRSPLVSLGTLDAALLGDGSSDWPRLTNRLAAAALLTVADVQRVEHLWWYGRLIANSDMHTGNLSFQPQGGQLLLAPAYDMLPMLYAPLPGGEVPARTFEPPLPPPQQRGAWLLAHGCAVEFWARAARDTRVGEAFRTVCASNLARLQRVAEVV